MLELHACLNLFPSEEISAEDLRRGDIFSSGRRWSIVSSIEVEEFKNIKSTHRVCVHSSIYSTSYFYNFMDDDTFYYQYEKVKIIRRGTFDLNLAIKMIEDEEERIRLREEERDREEIEEDDLESGFVT